MLIYRDRIQLEPHSVLHENHFSLEPTDLSIMVQQLLRKKHFKFPIHVIQVLMQLLR